MPFNGRKRVKVGPFYALFTLASVVRWLRTRQGTPWSSYGWKVGRVTRNMKRDQTSVDLPGPINWRSRGRS